MNNLDVVKRIEILRLGNNAEGVATINGKIAFIPFALPSENVDAKLMKENKSYSNYKLININKKSDSRVISICPYYEECGGCELQHLNYQKSLLFKEQNLQNNLNKIAKLVVGVKPAVPSLQKYNYRNKCSFPVSKINSKTFVGYYRRNSKEIVEVEECAIAKYEINEAYSFVKRFVEMNNLGYDYYSKSGYIKHIVIRVLNNHIQIVLVSKYESIPNLMELVNLLNENFQSYSLFINVNKIDNGEIFSDNFKLITGEPEIITCEFGIHYFVSPYSFLQINDYIKEKIYSDILNEISKDAVVIDAYSGSGLLSAIMAKKATKVFGIEINKSASLNANKLKEYNNISNLFNINGNCAVELPRLINKLKTEYNNINIVVDPARNGCDENSLNSICESGANKLIYLSCNPSTLARDLIILSKCYNIISVQPYDMFPQTSNLETLVIMQKKG